MTRLDKIENETLFILREARRHFKKPAVLWSMGKDSTALLWMIRKAFFGTVPFPVLHIDTSYKFREIYEFRDHYAKAWNLDLIVLRNENELATSDWPKGGSQLACCTALKTEPLKEAIHKLGFDAVFLGIRRDEHGIRAKERVFSPRTETFAWDFANQPAELWNHYHSRREPRRHIRVHPLLHMTELDIWKLVQRDDIPVCPLYFAKESQRYRSIGCAPCCAPIPSTAGTVREIVLELEATNTAERAGRAQDKEDAGNMQKLRSLGYM